MTILGTFIDRQASKTLTGNTLTTYPHSLATNPELMALQVRSVETATAPGQIIAVGGNASLLTIGLVGATIAAASNMVCFDMYSFLFHSIIR